MSTEEIKLLHQDIKYLEQEKKEINHKLKTLTHDYIKGVPAVPHQRLTEKLQSVEEQLLKKNLELQMLLERQQLSLFS